MSENIPDPEFGPEKYWVDHLKSVADFSSNPSSMFGFDRRLAIQASALFRKPNEPAIDRVADSLSSRLQEELNSMRQNAVSQGLGDSLEDRSLETISIMLIASRWIDTVAATVLGRNTNISTANLLNTRVAERLAFNFAAEHHGELDAGEGYLHLAIKACEDMADDVNYSWFGVKALNTARIMLDAHNAISVIASKAPAEVVDHTELKNDNDELFDLSKRLQKYAVKPAVVPAIEGNDLVREWKFESGAEIARQIQITLGSQFGNAAPSRKAIATIIGTDGKFKNSFVQFSAKSVVGSEEKAKSIALLTSEIDPEVPSRICSLFLLTRDGHLTTVGGYDLRKFSEKNLALDAYESLRTELIAHYFDLVTPLVVHQTAKEIQVEEEAKLEDGEHKPYTGFRRLNLGRKVLMEVLGDEVIEQVKKELVEAEADTKKRMMVKHPVVGHVREIDPAHRASQRARNQCLKETGIVLREYGETYIKKHERGDLVDDSKGHKVKFIGGSATRKLASKR